MASNRVYVTETLRCYVGTGKAAGDMVYLGAGIRGLLLDDPNSDNEATIQLDSPRTVATMPVLASTDSTSSPLSGASAVAFGDQLYVTDSAETISKDSSGTQKIGFALGTRNSRGAYASGTQVSAGATADCDVLMSA